MLPVSKPSLVCWKSKHALISTALLLSACVALLTAYRQVEQVQQKESAPDEQKAKTLRYSAASEEDPSKNESLSQNVNLTRNVTSTFISDMTYDDFSNESFLDLLDWEVSSMQALVTPSSNKRNRTEIDTSSCSESLPPGVPSSCCVGRIAGKKDRCVGLSLGEYQTVRDYALQQHMLPLPISEHPLQNAISNGQSPIFKASSTEITKCDLCHMMDLLYDHNITLGVYGDSMSSQMAESMECGLLRHGYSVLTNSSTSGPTIYTVSFNATFSAHRRWTHSVKIHVYKQYRVLPDLASHPDAPGNDPDVNALLLSFGLHWAAGPARDRKSPQDYFSALTRLFQHVKNGTATKTIKFIAWRETSAQHFDGNGGDYYHHKAKYPNGTDSNICVAMNRTESNHSSAGWREPVVQAAAQSIGFQIMPVQDLPLSKNSLADVAVSRKESQILPPIIVLPFFNYTAGLHYLHPMYTGDCTHYCQVPYLFWPIWRSLRIALEHGL